MGNLEKRIGNLEVRSAIAAGGHPRDRALHERVRECVLDDPELYVRYEDALDAHLEAIEELRTRERTRSEPAGETEVLETMEAMRTYEQLGRIERLLLGEDQERPDDESANQGSSIQ